MPADILLFALFAAVTGAALIWGMRAYRRGGGARRGLAVIVAAAISVAALALYFLIGRPDLPDQPYAERIAALKARSVDTYSDGEMLARLAAEARAAPRDARPHIASGLILFALDRNEEAARAFEAALRRDPNSSAAMVNLGRTLVRLDEGRVGPDAQRLFEAAAVKDPSDPLPWFYQALAATQQGRNADAGRLWRIVLARLPGDDPKRAMARQMIAESGR